MTRPSESKRLQFSDIQDELFQFSVDIETLIRDLQAKIADLQAKKSGTPSHLNLYWHTQKQDSNCNQRKIYEGAIEYLEAIIDNKILNAVNIQWLIERYPHVHREVPTLDIFMKIVVRISEHYAASIDADTLRHYRLNRHHPVSAHVNTIAKDAYFAIRSIFTESNPT